MQSASMLMVLGGVLWAAAAVQQVDRVLLAFVRNEKLRGLDLWWTVRLR